MNVKILSLETKSVRVDFGRAISDVAIAFQDLEAGTVISEILKLHTEAGACAAGLVVTGCVAPTTDEAMDKLAHWLDAFSRCLRERDRTKSFPIFQ